MICNKRNKTTSHTVFLLFAILLSVYCATGYAQVPFKNRLHKMYNQNKQKADSLYIVADSLVREYRVGERIDSIIEIRQHKYDFDTLYISHPAPRWTFKVRMNFAGTHLASRLNQDGVKSATDLDTDIKSTVSFGIAYRGISLGLGMSPSKLFKKNSDIELNISSYGRKFGFDATYLRANSFKGKANVGDNRFEIERGFLHQSLFALDAFYTLNHRRFSYAAAFSQTFEQKRSAGSFLLGVSFLAMRAKNDANEQIGVPSMRIYMGHIGIGAGYAHNIVLPNKWLIHVSSLPTMVVINRNNITVSGEKQKMPYYFPSLIISGHMAFIRFFKNYFAGMTFVANTSSIGRHDKIKLVHTKWRTRLVFGFRI